MWFPRVTQQMSHKRFRPKSYELSTRLWSQPLLLSVPVVLPNMQEELEQILCL